MQPGKLTTLLSCLLIFAAPAQAADGKDARKAIELDQARTAAIESRLRAVEMERSLLEAERRLDALRGGAVAFPVLVGIVTNSGEVAAEFADGAGIRVIRIGASVVPGWKLSAIADGAVSVRSTSGAVREIRVGTRGAQQ